LVKTPPSVISSSQCYPFRLKHGDKGRYLVATRNIQPLELVMTDLPCVVGPPAKTVPVCLECLTPVNNYSLSCPECSLPICSLSCISGPHHSQECQLLSQLDHSISIQDFDKPHLLYSAILPLRMWLLKSYNPSLWQKINFLQEGNIEELVSSNLWKDVADYIKDTMKIDNFPEEEFLRLTGIKATNANSLEPTGVSGTALYPLYPLMNSYCYCNTMYSIDKTNWNMEVRAQVMIPAGMEITTRYVLPTMSQPSRRNHIWNAWRFICTCDRCKDPTEFGTWYSGIRCNMCQSGWLLPYHADLGSCWECHTCGGRLEESELVKKLQKCKKRVEMCRDGEEEELLEELEQELHKNHEIIIEVKSKLLQRYSGEPQTRPVMDRRLQLAMDILQVMERIDPGLTPRRGGLLNQVVNTEIRKTSMDSSLGVIGKGNLAKQMRKAMIMMREMKLCLKYDRTLSETYSHFL